MPEMTVDDFVRTKVLPELQPVVAMIRELMIESAPGVQEIISYGNPRLQSETDHCSNQPDQERHHLFLRRGLRRHRLLKGKGLRKSSKHVKIKAVPNTNKDALRYYIQQALELESRNKPALIWSDLLATRKRGGPSNGALAAASAKSLGTFYRRLPTACLRNLNCWSGGCCFLQKSSFTIKSLSQMFCVL